MQVQNSVQAAISRLPQQVQQQGVRVTKSSPDFLLIVGVYDETDKSTNIDVSDWLSSNMQDQSARIPGVGDINVFGSSYAMRIWLDPDKLALIFADAGRRDRRDQRAERGGRGRRDRRPAAPQEQMLNATVTAQSKLQTPEQFRNIIVKSDPSGARVLLGDVARVELGAENYNAVSRVNGHPGAGIAHLPRARRRRAWKRPTWSRPRSRKCRRASRPATATPTPYDTTEFIKLSIEEVVKTLIEAIILVMLVMFVFLQSWRATLIPAIAVPVVLLGTFAILYALDFSINTLTLFGLVLAIGMLVDDAIVVVENVERLLEEHPELTPREATIMSMNQIQMALIAIALSLSAVFMPMVFFGGSTGVIYRQFSATIVSAMVLSIFVAMTLSPALAATLLKQKNGSARQTACWSGASRPSWRFSSAAAPRSTTASPASATPTCARSASWSTASGSFLAAMASFASC